MKFLRSICLVIAALALVTGCGSPAAPAADPLAFTERTVDGATFSGQSLAGGPAVLWFWAPWCTVCQGEAPTVAKVANAGADVPFVGVAAQDEVPAMREFVAKYGLGSFPHLADLDASVWARFGVITQPAFAFIGADGSVDMVMGVLSEEELAARVEALDAT
ncbi:MAG: protein disulfide oxidoreductase [Pseudonocardia sp.]|nr:protein disulfide oxidoreductase [Pseudonocardia sp.]